MRTGHPLLYHARRGGAVLMRLINQPTAGRRPSSVQDSVHRTAQYRRPAFSSLLCVSPFYYRGGLVATQTGRVPVVRASIIFAAVIDCNSIRRQPGAACAALGDLLRRCSSIAASKHRTFAGPLCLAATNFPSPSAAVNLPPFTCSDGRRCAWRPEGVGGV